MGLFRKRKDDWPRGTAHVVSVNRLPRSGTSTSLRADVVVQAPGIAPFPTEYKELVVSISKFPAPGTVLPVRINPNDYHDIDVLWDEVPTHHDVARQQAAQLAATMRAGDENPSGQQTPTPSDAPPGAGDIVRLVQHLSPDAEVHIGTPPAAGPPTVNVTASNSDADPVERLEKLAALHANGIIDDTQFAALKAQILGQAGLD